MASFVSTSKRIYYASNYMKLDANPSANTGTDQTANFNALAARVYNSGGGEIVIDGPLASYGGLKHYGNTILRGVGGGMLFWLGQGQNQTAQSLLINANPFAGVGNPTDDDLVLADLYIDGNRRGGVGFNFNDGATNEVSQGHKNSSGYYMFVVQYSGVNRLKIDNVKVNDGPCFHMICSGINRLGVSGLTIDTPAGIYTNTDGLHLVGPIGSADLSDMTFHTQDDALAINIDDGHLASPLGQYNVFGRYVTNGPAGKISVRGVHLNNCATGIRSISAVSRVESLSIRDVKGTYWRGLFTLDCDPYELSSLGSGNYGSLLVDGVQCQQVASQNGGNYNTYTWAAFGANAERITIRNAHINTLINRSAPIQVVGQGVIKRLDVEGLSVLDPSGVINSSVVQVGSGATVTDLRVVDSSFDRGSQSTARDFVQVAGGTVTKTMVNNVRTTSVAHIISVSSGVLGAIQPSQIEMVNGTALLSTSVSATLQAPSSIIAPHLVDPAGTGSVTTVASAN